MLVAQPVRLQSAEGVNHIHGLPLQNKNTDIEDTITKVGQKLGGDDGKLM